MRISGRFRITYVTVGQTWVPRMEPRYVKAWTKTSSPYPGGLILTHTHLTPMAWNLLIALLLFSLAGAIGQLPEVSAFVEADPPEGAVA